MRGVDAITAYEDDASRLTDSELLDRASRLQRVLFTQDDDLLSEAAKRQRDGIPFNGVIYAHQLRVSIGTCVEDLEFIAKAGEPEDLIGRVEFLPLRRQ
jgi:predicted nuclease of predicted toxin-antitoxin system